MLSNAWLSSWDPVAAPVEVEQQEVVVKKRERPSTTTFEPSVIHVTFEEPKPFVVVEPVVEKIRHVPDVIPSILEQRSGSRVQPERRTKKR